MPTHIYKKFCTYITICEDVRLPTFYIGSSSTEKINKGYRGSVCSKKYKTLWKQCMKENPHLFKINILSYHDERDEATLAEKLMQKSLKVVKASNFTNMAIATPNGFFGMSTKGIKRGPQSPEHAASRRGKKDSPETRTKKSAAKKGDKNPMYGKKDSPKTRTKKSAARLGKKRGPYKKKN